ncbi:MAG: AAA family ATPase [Candidatus Woesearchaeota archaeon]
MEQWYEELDFEENPFSTNPSNFVKNLVGREDVIDELMYRVRAGSIVFVEGEEGMGKTSLLRYLIKKFRGRGKVIFVDCAKLEKELNIEDLLVMRNGFMKGMLLKNYPKDMILLLDNVSELSHLNNERIKYFFDQGYLRSVVFTGNSYESADFSESLRQRVAKVIKLEKLEEYQAVDMIRDRIGDIKFFSDEVIEKIADLSGYVPKKILHNAEEVAEFVINIDEDQATVDHVTQVLNKKGEKNETEKKAEKETSPVSDVSDAALTAMSGSGNVSEISETKDDDSLEKEEDESEDETEEDTEKKKSDFDSEKKKDDFETVSPEEDNEDDEDEDFSPEIKEVEDLETTKISVDDLKKEKKSYNSEVEDDFFDDDDVDEESEDSKDEDTSDEDESDKKESSEDKKKKYDETDDSEVDDDFFDDDFDEDEDDDSDKKRGDDL